MCSEYRVLTPPDGTAWEMAKGKLDGLAGRAPQHALYYTHGCVECRELQVANYLGWKEGNKILERRLKSLLN